MAPGHTCWAPLGGMFSTSGELVASSRSQARGKNERKCVEDARRMLEAKCLVCRGEVEAGSGRKHVENQSRKLNPELAVAF